MRITSASLALALILLPSVTRADDAPPPDLRASLVVVVAEGEANGVKRYTRATGFFISRQGLLVTSNHLRTRLGKVDPGSYHIRAYADEVSVTPMPAAEIWSSELTDVLVLRVSTGNLQYRVLSRGDFRKVRIGRTTLYTSGFPDGLPRLDDHGFATSLSGPVDNPQLVWTTNLNFNEGQSGSPLVDNSGRVVALVRGSDEASPRVGFVVPANAVPADYWDSSSTEAPEVATGAEVATLVATTTVPAISPRRRSVTLDLSNQVCSPPTTLGRVVPASTGWAIQPATVRLTTLRALGPNVTGGIVSADADQVAVNAKIANVGICLKAFGKVVTPDTPGQWQAQLDFLETPLAGTTQVVTLARSALVAGRTVPVAVGAVSNLSLSVERPDGSTVAVPSTSQTVVMGVRSLRVDATSALTAAGVAVPR